MHNGIKAVLKYWGEPVYLFNTYLKSQDKIEEAERRAYDKLKKQELMERRMLGYDSDDINMSPEMKQMKRGMNSMALMPITENQ